MNAYRSIWLVMQREITERMRARVFQVSTAILVVLVAGGVVAAVELPDVFETGPKKVGTVGTVPEGFADALSAAQHQTNIEVETVSFGDEKSGEEALAKGDVSALLRNSSEIVFNKRADEKIERTLNQAVQTAALPQRLGELGITAEQLRSIVQPQPVETTFLNPADQEEGNKPSEGEQVIGIGAVALLLFAISIYGNVVLTGVIEEKSNRVVEVLLGTMRPVDLLVGKVAGIMTVAMVQFAAGLGAAVVALIAVGAPSDMPDTTFAATAVAVGSFLLGLTFFSLAYAAQGAMVARPEQASTNLPMGVLVGAVYVMSLSLLEQPESPILRIVSILPPTSAFLMPQRVAIGDPPFVEIVAAAVLMIGAIFAMARAAGRIYSGAILSSGGKVQLLRAWRSSGEAMQQ
jgi:ABC-2 type transport system permease protein